jgi:hypothetical protein
MNRGRTPRLKPEENSPTRAARLEAELPRMNAGALAVTPGLNARLLTFIAVGAPCFSRRSDASASRKESRASINRALAPVSLGPRDHVGSGMLPARSAESL